MICIKPEGSSVPILARLASDVLSFNMPISEIATGITAAKHLAQLIQGIKAETDAVRINDIVIESQQLTLSLQQSLLDAQAMLDKITEEKRELAAKIAKNDDWRDQASSYSLREICAGVLAYEFAKKDDSDLTPPRWACPKCFTKQQIQILQRSDNPNPGVDCQKCNLRINALPES